MSATLLGSSHISHICKDHKRCDCWTYLEDSRFNDRGLPEGWVSLLASASAAWTSTMQRDGNRSCKKQNAESPLKMLLCSKYYIDSLLQSPLLVGQTECHARSCSHSWAHLSCDSKREAINIYIENSEISHEYLEVTLLSLSRTHCVCLSFVIISDQTCKRLLHLEIAHGFILGEASDNRRGLLWSPSL